MLVVFGTRWRGRAVHDGPGHCPEDAGLEAVPQRRQPACRLGGQLRDREAGGGAQAGDRRHVLGAGAAVPLVLAAGQDREHAVSRA